MAASGRGLSDATVEAVSGSIGSIVSLVATYPLKTIYTIQALSTGGDAAAALSTLDVIKKYKLGLYAGLEPNIVESGLSSGVYFYLYSKLRHFAVTFREGLHAKKDGVPAPAATSGSTKHKEIGILSSLLVAAVAGAGNQLLTMPASVVATRMQAQKKLVVEGRAAESSAGAGAIIGRVYAESGVGGFWAGLLPSLVLVANPAIQYMLYEQILRAMRRWKQVRMTRSASPERASSSSSDKPTSRSASTNNVADSASAAGPSASTSSTDIPKASSTTGAAAGLKARNSKGGAAPGTSANSKSAQPVKLSAGEVFLASALAKIGATIATYWLVVVKSRLQAASKSSGELQYKGTWDCLSRIWAEEGLGGFFKGLRPKILQTALNAALMLMLKEQLYSTTKNLLTTKNLKSVAQAVINA